MDAGGTPTPCCPSLSPEARRAPPPPNTLLDFPLKAEAFLSLALAAAPAAPPSPGAAVPGHGGRRAGWPPRRLAEQALALCVLTKGVAYTRRLCERHRLRFDDWAGAPEASAGTPEA